MLILDSMKLDNLGLLFEKFTNVEGSGTPRKKEILSECYWLPRKKRVSALGKHVPKKHLILSSILHPHHSETHESSLASL